MNVYTSTGYHPDKIETYDQKVLAQKGYMQSPNDWKNVEITGYAKLNSYDSNAYFSWYARSGRHTHNTAPNGENQECEGTGVKPRIYFNGNTASVKEIWHNDGYAVTNRITGSTEPLQGRWMGIKTVIYDVKMPDGTTAVKQELWIDEKNDKASWHKVNEYLDKGGWQAHSNICGGTLDQKILWGGPMITFRWDKATDVDFKNLSVREIQPPVASKTTQPPSDNTATTTTTARIKTGDSRYDQFDSLILTSTKKYGMSSDPMMIKAMIMQESSFDQYSISSDSPCGVPNGWSNIESKSFGLMQVTPACGEGEEGGGGRPNLTRDSSSPAWATSWFNPTYNIDQGVKEYMKVMQYLKNKFGGCGESQYIKMALGGYNSGSDSIFGCTSWSNRAGTYINNVLEHYGTF
jgi:hypothetical protein